MEYAIVGLGRMGRAIEEQAARRGHRRVAAVDPAARDEPGRAGGIGRETLGGAVVAFEFTVPEAAERNVHDLLRLGISVVCGTTGWSPSAKLDAVASAYNAGLVIAPNFSVGMNLFYRLVDQAGRLFGSAGLHQPYVFEAHHRAKRDVPSGTARRLASILVEADPRLDGIHEGNPAEPLPDGTLHVASVRAGSEFGSHAVGFDGEFDKITLAHGARGRAGFALGAVLAAEWILGKSGRHGFDEVLEDLVGARGDRRTR